VKEIAVTAMQLLMDQLAEKKLSTKHSHVLLKPAFIARGSA
jgi:hypothetical protein